MSHSRRCTNGEKSIRHKIHGYVICYTLNKRALRPQTLQSLPAFYCSALCRFARDRRCLRYLGHFCFFLLITGPMKKRKRSQKGNSEFGESCKPGSNRLELTFVPRFLAVKKRSHGRPSRDTPVTPRLLTSRESKK